MQNVENGLPESGQQLELELEQGVQEVLPWVKELERKEEEIGRLQDRVSNLMLVADKMSKELQAATTPLFDYRQIKSWGKCNVCKEKIAPRKDKVFVLKTRGESTSLCRLCVHKMHIATIT